MRRSQPTCCAVMCCAVLCCAGPGPAGQLQQRGHRAQRALPPEPSRHSSAGRGRPQRRNHRPDAAAGAAAAWQAGVGPGDTFAAGECRERWGAGALALCTASRAALYRGGLHSQPCSLRGARAERMPFLWPAAHSFGMLQRSDYTAACLQRLHTCYAARRACCACCTAPA